MEYTQLDFAPYSPKRRMLVEQAGFLVREIVGGHVHPFPCTCGACICGQPVKGKKAGARRFSKRTLFMYFLRADMFAAAMVGPLSRTKKGKWLKKMGKIRMRVARVQRKDQWFDKNLKREPAILTTDVLVEQLRRRTRKKTREMIQQLFKRERRQDVKEFLAGFLINRDFYTYYGRAGSEELGSRVEAARKELAAMTARPGSSRRRRAAVKLGHPLLPRPESR
jgi:hypothetical protein